MTRQPHTSRRHPADALADAKRAIYDNPTSSAPSAPTQSRASRTPPTPPTPRQTLNAQPHRLSHHSDNRVHANHSRQQYPIDMGVDHQTGHAPNHDPNHDLDDSLADWVEQARDTVRNHPLICLGATVATTAAMAKFSFVRKAVWTTTRIAGRLALAKLLSNKR